jgi:hypothetical protein
MKIPFKIGLLEVRHIFPKYIIIHHSFCTYSVNPLLKIDNPSLQIPKLGLEVLEQKTPDINYHVIMEQIGEDFYPILARPLNTICTFDDIDSSINKLSIHVAVLGSYDLKIPTPRLYEVLAYRVINPLSRSFRIPEKRIKLHYEVSNNKEQTCPGAFLDKDVIIAMRRKYMKK